MIGTLAEPVSRTREEHEAYVRKLANRMAPPDRREAAVALFMRRWDALDGVGTPNGPTFEEARAELAAVRKAWEEL